jgi:hypothetical protein
MIELLENFLLALTDAQFDKILIMIGDGFSSIADGVKVVWNMASPLLIGLIALQLARYQAAAREARKTIVEKIETESKNSQADRTKIIEDLQVNTKISEDAFIAANSHNEKIAAVVDYVKPKIPPMP